MNKSNLLYKRLYILLFLFSLVGFGYNFGIFIKNNFLNVPSGSVAGSQRVKLPLRVELRVNDRKLAEGVLSTLSGDKNLAVTKVTYTNNSYKNDFLLDLTDGSKITEISDLENILMLGSSKEIPAGEEPSNADVLLIVTTK